MMTSIYEKLPSDFFDASQRSVNPVTRHYHCSRYSKIREFISGPYRKGMRILDIGSGSASWNTARLDVTGLDQNRAMLDYGKRMGYLKKVIEWDLGNVPLPLEEGGFDFIVISEVLEHLDQPGAILRESFRILKKGGLLVITVPLDTPLSPWSILFELNCILLGDVLGDECYKKRCGHINHFSPESMEGLLKENGFGIAGRKITLMNIGIVGRK